MSPKIAEITRVPRMSFRDWIRCYVLPSHCVLCGKFKLFGWNPHKECAEEELRRYHFED